MQQLIINPEFGLAGDMFSGALISAGAPAKQVICIMEEAAALLGGAGVKVCHETRAGIKGVLLEITLIEPPHATEAGLLLLSLEKILEKWQITDPYRNFAVKALSILITGEQLAHARLDNHARQQHQQHDNHCYLHEAQDILIDIAGAALSAQLLAIDMTEILCLSPVATGSGTVIFSHGTLQIPAPATAAIIAKYNLPVVSGDLETELLTPTGAALLAALNPCFLEHNPAQAEMKDLVTGIGFGTKKLIARSGKPNALTLYLVGRS